MSRDELPCGEQGPFEHLRKNFGFDGETFPARFVQIFWNHDETSGSNHQVSAWFVPRNIDGFDFMSNRNDAFLKICADAFFDMGNSLAGWFEDPRPAEVFGSMLRRGFTNTDELVRALKEFSMLDECDWAREMLMAFPDYQDNEE